MKRIVCIFCLICLMLNTYALNAASNKKQSVKTRAKVYEIVTSGSLSITDINTKVVKKLKGHIKAMVSLYSLWGGTFDRNLNSGKLPKVLGYKTPGCPEQKELIKRFFPNDDLANQQLSRENYDRFPKARSIGRYYDNLEYLKITEINDTIIVDYRSDVILQDLDILITGPDIYLYRDSVFKVIKRNIVTDWDAYIKFQNNSFFEKSNIERSYSIIKEPTESYLEPDVDHGYSSIMEPCPKMNNVPCIQSCSALRNVVYMYSQLAGLREKIRNDSNDNIDYHYRDDQAFAEYAYFLKDGFIKSFPNNQLAQKLEKIRYANKIAEDTCGIAKDKFLLHDKFDRYLNLSINTKGDTVWVNYKLAITKNGKEEIIQATDIYQFEDDKFKTIKLGLNL